METKKPEVEAPKEPVKKQPMAKTVDYGKPKVAIAKPSKEQVKAEKDAAKSE